MGDQILIKLIYIRILCLRSPLPIRIGSKDIEGWRGETEILETGNLDGKNKHKLSIRY